MPEGIGGMGPEKPAGLFLGGGHFTASFTPSIQKPDGLSVVEAELGAEKVEAMKITMVVTLPTSPPTFNYTQGYWRERTQESEMQGFGRMWELEEEGTDRLQRKEVQAKTLLS